MHTLKMFNVLLPDFWKSQFQKYFFEEQYDKTR